MKNKLLVTICLFMFVGVISAFAGWNSYSPASDAGKCYNQNCVTWHNSGYYGYTDSSPYYPNGISFATFNGYKDQETYDGRNFQEMQFAYLETQMFSANNDPPTNPWDYRPSYIFTAPQATSYNLNFTTNQPKKIGVWAYLHNNGVGGDYPNGYPALDTKLSLTDAGSLFGSNAKTQYKPTYKITASNTYPKQVMADVTITGNKPFTLNPTQGFLIREQTNGGGTNIVDLTNTNNDLDRMLSNAGLLIRNRSGVNPGVVESCDQHYMMAYVEFEAVPEEEEAPVLCEEFDISPSVIEVNTPTVIQITTLTDTKGNPFRLENGTNPMIQYCFIRANEATFTPSQYALADNKCARAPYGTNITFSATTAGTLYVSVVGSESVCNDQLKTRVIPEENVVCDELTTDPGNGESVEANQAITISVDTLTDTDGGAYYDPSPIFEYCFSGSINWNSTRNTYSTVSLNPSCIRTYQKYMQDVYPFTPGAVTIKVVGSEQACNDVFTVNIQREGVCEDLDIVQQNFDDNGEYSVTLDLEPDTTSYEIHWEVRGSNGQTKVSTTIANRNSIDLSDPAYNYVFVPGDTLTANAIINKIPDTQICIDSLTSQEEDCERFTLNRENFVRANQRICFRTDWPYFDEVRYETSGGRTGSLDVVDENCFILTKNISDNADWIDIWVPGYQNICEDRLRYEERPPLFDKFIRAEGDSSWRTDKTVATFNDSNLEYKIEYTHYNDGVQDVTITDTIGEGPIRGDVREGDGQGGTITYNNSMNITAGGRTLDECDDDDDEALCYEGDIGRSSGVNIYNLPDNEKVVITYMAKLESSINPGDCSDPASIFNVEGICGETYENTARFEDDTAEGDDDTELWIPCPFIIIRAGGDVLFENPLDYGVDTLYCADIANADVPIIIPEEETPGTPSTGGDTVSPVYTGDICKQKNAPGYVDLTSSFSSLICEVSFKTTEDLTQRAIVQSINTNKEKISRFEKNLNGTDNITNENMLPESRNGVYYKNDRDLTFGVGSTPVEFSNGAKTFIVEDHNVIINSNIVYKDADPANMPSIAIIVINGSIIIDKDVTETSGVLFVQEGDNADSGKVCAGPFTAGNPCQEPQQYSDVQLIHYGSIYGDIEHLFKYRVYAGDPTKEEGALVIRFDNRVYINTPPVLNELVQISQEITS